MFRTGPCIFPTTNVPSPITYSSDLCSISPHMIPTSVFWKNLLIGDNTPQMVHTLPYDISLSYTSITISYASSLTTGTAYACQSFVPGVTITLPAISGLKRRVIDAGPMSCTVDWGTVVQVYLVRGCPYVTIVTKVPLNLKGLATPTWGVYTMNNSPIGSYIGTFRVAAIPGPGWSALLSQYANDIVTGSSIGTSITRYIGTVTMTWVCNGTPLMLALPHHVDIMTPIPVGNIGSYTSIRGPMIPVIGPIWTLTYKLPTVEWLPDKGIDSDKLTTVTSSLVSDMEVPITATDTYFGGKELARLAQLLLIANRVGMWNDTAFNTLLNTVNGWLSGKFVYDNMWGGVNQEAAMKDSTSDFGYGIYNDHMYHNGYLLYAMAVVAWFSPSWLTTARTNAMIDIARDIANPTSDGYFPMTRHVDWYENHSWASGLVNRADVNDTESTSEAVNAYHAIYLLGEALHNDTMELWGRLLSAMEIRSAQYYWHIVPSRAIYPAPLNTYPTIGIVWSDKAEYRNWFTVPPYGVTGIQLLPFTSISSVLLNEPTWIAEVIKIYPNIDIDGWRGYIIMLEALVNKSDAWNKALTLTSYDDGNSRTNTLFWIASQV